MNLRPARSTSRRHLRSRVAYVSVDCPILYVSSGQLGSLTTNEMPSFGFQTDHRQHCILRPTLTADGFCSNCSRWRPRHAIISSFPGLLSTILAFRQSSLMNANLQESRTLYPSLNIPNLDDHEGSKYHRDFSSSVEAVNKYMHMS